MKERPIIFSAPMVKALLEGRKTQTRRFIKPQPNWSNPRERSAASPEGWQIPGHSGIWSEDGDAETEVVKCPYGVIGDRLWVKETWSTLGMWDEVKPSELDVRSKGNIRYLADGKRSGKLRPSLFMPRWASRITLEITDIRVQRLQQIDSRDALAEGVNPRSLSDFPDPVGAYQDIWESINGKEKAKCWEANPWVWCIGLNVVEPQVLAGETR